MVDEVEGEEEGEGGGLKNKKREGERRGVGRGLYGLVRGSGKRTRLRGEGEEAGGEESQRE